MNVGPYTSGMEFHLTTDTEAKLQELAAETGRAPNELLEDAIAGYFKELAQVRGALDSRYDEIKSGKVEPVEGETFFENLRRQEEELSRRRPNR